MAATSAPTPVFSSKNISPRRSATSSKRAVAGSRIRALRSPGRRADAVHACREETITIVVGGQSQGTTGAGGHHTSRCERHRRLARRRIRLVAYLDVPAHSAAARRRTRRDVDGHRVARRGCWSPTRRDRARRALLRQRRGQRRSSPQTHAGQRQVLHRRRDQSAGRPPVSSRRTSAQCEGAGHRVTAGCQRRQPLIRGETRSATGRRCRHDPGPPGDLDGARTADRQAGRALPRHTFDLFDDTPHTNYPEAAGVFGNPLEGLLTVEAVHVAFPGELRRRMHATRQLSIRCTSIPASTRRAPA